MRNLSDCRILIVDDAKLNVDVLVCGLRNDYKLSVAMDGMTALKSVESIVPDLILLDVMMPRIDGFEVCRRLKENPATRDIPIIFLTALSDLKNKTRAFDYGAVDFLGKPFEIIEVKARVKTHLTLKLAMEELEKQNQELIEAAKLREDVEHITRHDLKAPLNSIISFPAFIKDEGNLTAEQTKLLDMMEQSGWRMLEMINKSLDLYKMERGTYEFQPEEVDAIKVLKRIRGEFRSLFEGKIIDFVILLEGNPLKKDDVFMVSGEELLCYSLFANLVKNAVEASPGGERIVASLSSAINNGGVELSIRISNKGSVPQEIRESFFDKLISAKKTGGTGLGTYAARLAVVTQGGSIHLDCSVPDETSITVNLKPAGKITGSV